jgi:hypothetical protein
MNAMPAQRVTRDNLPNAVDEVLGKCREQMVGAQGALAEDLDVAIAALELIKSELSGETPQRPRGQRSALFIRYAIDSDDKLAMNDELKEMIVKIEDVYKRL